MTLDLAHPDLDAFGEAFQALAASASLAIETTQDVAHRKAWESIHSTMLAAVLAADLGHRCPLCGNLADLVPCQWCGTETCGEPQCRRDAHAGEPVCPHTPAHRSLEDEAEAQAAWFRTLRTYPETGNTPSSRFDK